jgi:hypothetical protein
MRSAEYVLTVGLLVVVGGTAALASRTPQPSSEVPVVPTVALEVDGAGLLLAKYGLYIPLPAEIGDAAQF